MKCSFISLYQETISQEKISSKPTDILLGTQTRTDSREGVDQDPWNRNTQTFTTVRGNSDSDNSYAQFVMIPQ